jgi:hypothetical protein
MNTAFRPSHALDQVRGNLGLLGDLPGTFIGTGFNLIARPKKPMDPQRDLPFFLEVNATQEILEFTNIGGDIPNRGFVQDDVKLHGVHYLQRVADCELHTAIHLEPGLWVRVDPTTAPNPVAPESYARLATIPHGDSLLALSTFAERLNTGPTIDPVDSTPFTGDIPDLNGSPTNPITNDAYLAQYRGTPLPKECLPAGLVATEAIKNPALVLKAVIDLQKQLFNETVVMKISTASVQNHGIVNIPFVVNNANATQLDAIFWIEKVVDPSGGPDPYIQLQYVQRVILDFDNIHWPHISVATLVKTL